MNKTTENTAPSKVHFISLGCPKNLVDSEIMAGTLLKDGYSVVNEAGEADTVIVNTCGFIEDSKQESIQKILEMTALKEQGQIKRVVVAGCLTQRYKTELVEGLPEADLLLDLVNFKMFQKFSKDTKKVLSKKRSLIFRPICRKRRLLE